MSRLRATHRERNCACGMKTFGSNYFILKQTVFAMLIEMRRYIIRYKVTKPTSDHREGGSGRKNHCGSTRVYSFTRTIGAGQRWVCTFASWAFSLPSLHPNPQKMKNTDMLCVSQKHAHEAEHVEACINPHCAKWRHIRWRLVHTVPCLATSQLIKPLVVCHFSHLLFSHSSTRSACCLQHIATVNSP